MRAEEHMILARRSDSDMMAQEMLLFVCSGNTCRSPMAAAIARHELAGITCLPRPQIGSAGVAVRSPGAPISPGAAAALSELGIGQEPGHQSRQLTADMCVGSTVIYCMTQRQRDMIVTIAPEVAERTFCLDPASDVPDPVGKPLDAYRNCAADLRRLVRARLAERLELYPAPGAEGA
jgi:protein-tyrosine-phosphatase